MNVMALKVWIGLAVVLIGLGTGMTAYSQVETSGRTYYIDCASGSDMNAGTTAEAPWRSVAPVNVTIFAPGDTILFKRGTRCMGLLYPKGSGTDGAPITLGAYGSGPLPIIDGQGYPTALHLFNQEYWHVRDLELTGSSTYGILVGAKLNHRALTHFRLTNLVVHDVYGGPVAAKWTGLVVFAPEGDHPVFNDIVIDGVTAYNTNQWGGIVINGGTSPLDMDDPAFGTGVTVRNSTVSNVYGDGIVLWYVKDGLIEHSVAYDTGQQPAPQTIGTPSAIWTWACHDCTVQFNEAYRSASPEFDAGSFDVDWATKNNVYQYNYGHDSDGYCLSVFGAEGFTTVNAIVRYNVCQNNGQRSDLAQRQGDMFIATWNEGAIDGVQVYNNTFYWNPAEDAALLKTVATLQGDRPAFFKNNIVYSTSSFLVDSNGDLELDHNLYWVAADAAGDPVWAQAGEYYASLPEFQSRSGQEANSLYSDPANGGECPQTFLLPDDSPAIDAGIDVGDMGDHDAFQNPIPQGDAINIGAYEGYTAGYTQPNTLAPLDALPGALPGDLPGHVVLLAFVDAGADGSARNLSRSQIVFLNSMARQYGPSGVRVVAVDTSGADNATLAQIVQQWQLTNVALIAGTAEVVSAFTVAQAPTTLLIGADGLTLHRWDRFASAQELALALQTLVGPPTFD